MYRDSAVSRRCEARALECAPATVLAAGWGYCRLCRHWRTPKGTAPCYPRGKRKGAPPIPRIGKRSYRVTVRPPVSSPSFCWRPPLCVAPPWCSPTTECRMPAFNINRPFTFCANGKKRVVNLNNTNGCENRMQRPGGASETEMPHFMSQKVSRFRAGDHLCVGISRADIFRYKVARLMLSRRAASTRLPPARTRASRIRERSSSLDRGKGVLSIPAGTAM